jgi:acetoin utilization deacetylase AcuC-like enzyme
VRSLKKLLRHGRLRLAPHVGWPRVDFVYGREYQTDLPAVSHDSRRGERILSFLDWEGLLDRRFLHRPEPVTYRLLRHVHTDEYLDSLNQTATLTPIVGFDMAEQAAERLVEGQRAMTGGTVLAARLALESKGIAANLGGGFHHAFANKGARFCLFNDVAAAITDLRENGFGGPILVVDLDLHDGDGTRSLFARDPTVYTFSIHNQSNPQPGEEAVASTSIELGGGVDDKTYLDAIRTHLPPVFTSFRPELVIYLAGCDPAAGDEIGDWKISAHGMLERDRFVLHLARGLGRKGPRRLPLVIVLAGGYGQRSWRYSARFLSYLVLGRPVEPPTTEESVLMLYRQLARGYGEPELTSEPAASGDEGADWGLTEEDIGMALGGPRRPRRLLGYYTPQGLELALERTGFLDRLRALGFPRPVAELDLDNPTGDTVRFWADRRKADLLIEVRMRIDRGTAPDLALLRVEWLLLQNPHAQPTPERPLLPGQRHPGLGMLQDIMALMVLVCDRLQLDGVLFVPAHYHTAAYGRKLMRSLDPVDEARLRALRAVLDRLPLAEATHAIDSGRVVDARTGEPAAWEPRPLVFPVSQRLRERLEAGDYERQVAEAAPRFAFALR